MISLRRGGLSVPSSLFRSHDCPESVHEGTCNCGGSSLSQEIQHSSSKLFGRLVDSEQIPPEYLARQNDSSQALVQFGFHGEQSQISINSSSTAHIPRKYVRYQEGHCFSDGRKAGKSKISCSEHFKRSLYSKGFHGTSGNDSVLSRSYPKCQVVHETYSATSAQSLEPSSYETFGQSSINTSAEISSELVLFRSEHWSGQIFCEQIIPNHTNHRCQWYDGLGRSHEQSDMSGQMGQIPESNAYKLLGNVGSSVQCTPISS